MMDSDMGTQSVSRRQSFSPVGFNEAKPQLDSLQWPEPFPLQRIQKSLAPVMPLPPLLIPEPYREWVLDVTERMQCPVDYVAIGALITTASLIGAGCSIRPKQKDSWTVIPNLWGGIVGAPSTLKTPALKEIMRPLETLEKEAWAAYETAYQHYLVEIEAYRASKEAIKKHMMKAAHTSDELALNMAKEKLRHLKEPSLPLVKRYSTNDATIEKMQELLSQNPRGLLLFRDELMGLLTGWEKEGHEGDRTFYLEAWNGYGSKTTDRIGRGTIHTKNLCVSLLGSTQPSKLLSYFQKTLSGNENDGLLQRFQLLVYPDLHPWRLVDKYVNKAAQETFSRIMAKLATLNFQDHGAHVEGSDDIPYFHFDDSAQEVFYEWLTDLEEKLFNPHDEPLLIEHLTKYRKLMPSLALIFHLIEIANGNTSGPVSRACVERAAGWCDYLEAHARRIYDLGLSPSYKAARTLAQKIHHREIPSPFDARDIYRKESPFLKTREEVVAACNILIQNGWLKEVPLSTSERGKTKTCYLINPKVMEIQR